MDVVVKMDDVVVESKLLLLKDSMKMKFYGTNAEQHQQRPYRLHMAAHCVITTTSHYFVLTAHFSSHLISLLALAATNAGLTAVDLTLL